MAGQYKCIAKITLMYTPRRTCLCTQYIDAKKEMTERIRDKLLLIQEDLGGIPKSFYSNVLKEAELAGGEDAQTSRWLSEQGQ